MPKISFTLWTFSSGIEIEHWAKMGLHFVVTSRIANHTDEDPINQPFEV